MSLLSVALKSPIGKFVVEKLLGVVIKNDEVVQKNVLASKTVWGGLVAALPSIIGAFGISIGTEEVNALVSGFGVLVVLWGRVTAKAAVK